MPRVKETRILLVDDDLNVTRMVASSLRKSGCYDVHVENDSSLAAVAARKIRPEVVILDIDMPGKDGGDVAKELKNDPHVNGATLIFMSGLVSQKEKGIRNGAIYLPKPFPLPLLNRLVELIITKRATLRKAPRRRKGGDSALEAETD